MTTYTVEVSLSLPKPYDKYVYVGVSRYWRDKEMFMIREKKDKIHKHLIRDIKSIRVKVLPHVTKFKRIYDK